MTPDKETFQEWKDRVCAALLADYQREQREWCEVDRAMRRDALIAFGAIVVWAVTGTIGLIWLITRS